MNSLAPMPMHEERELPRFSLREIDLPNVATMKVGDKLYLVLKVELVSQRSRKDLTLKSEKEKVEGDFQVLSVRPLGKKPVNAEDLERKDFENTIADVRSGKL